MFVALKWKAQALIGFRNFLLLGRPPCKLCMPLFTFHTGKLVLSVVKDTYEQLGLQGSPSRYQKHHRYGKALMHTEGPVLIAFSESVE